MTESAPPEDDDWQRLPKSAVVTMYINGIQKFVRDNILVFFGAGTGFALSDAFGLRELVLIGGLLLLAGLLIALIYHRRFQYRIDEKNIRVRKGFFERKELKVPFDRVQTTGMSQPIYMKPLGLTRFTLQTPGAAITEVALPGIPFTQAEALRDRIASIQYKGQPGESSQDSPNGIEEDSESPAKPEAVALFEAKPGDLFLYGLTNNQIWIMIGALSGPLFGILEDRIGSLVEWLQGLALFQMLNLGESPFLLVFLVIVLLLVFGALLMSLSGVLAIVRFYRYRLTAESDGFKSRFGLLDRREKTLKKIKLHSIQLVQTAIGRAIGRWHLIGHQTGMSELAELSGGSQKFLVPGVPNARIFDMAEGLDDYEFNDPDWQPIDPLFRRVLTVRISLLMIAFAVLIQLLPTDHLFTMDIVSLVTLAGNLLLLPMIRLRCKRWGYVRQTDMLLIRSGFIGQSIMRFELQRCQQLRVKQSPLQRRRGLANLVIRLPHGEVVIPWIEFEQARDLANILLYRIESAALHSL